MNELESEKNKLEVQIQRNEFNLKEIPSLKKRLKDQESEIERLMKERDDLAAKLKQNDLNRRSDTASADRVRYLERQLEITNNENKKLNENI